MSLAWKLLELVHDCFYIDGFGITPWKMGLKYLHEFDRVFENKCCFSLFAITELPITMDVF